MVYQVDDGFLLVSWPDSCIAKVDQQGNKVAVYNVAGQGPDGLTVPVFLSKQDDRYQFINKKRSFVEFILNNKSFDLNILNTPPIPRKLGRNMHRAFFTNDYQLTVINFDSESSGILYHKLVLNNGEWKSVFQLKQTSNKPETIYWNDDHFFVSRFMLTKEDDDYVVLVYKDLPKSFFEEKPLARLSAPVSNKIAPVTFPYKGIVNNVCVVNNGYLVEFGTRRGEAQHSGSYIYWDFYDEEGNFQDRVFMDDAAIVPIINAPGAFMMSGDYDYLHPMQMP